MARLESISENSFTHISFNQKFKLFKCLCLRERGGESNIISCPKLKNRRRYLYFLYLFVFILVSHIKKTNERKDKQVFAFNYMVIFQ